MENQDLPIQYPQRRESFGNWLLPEVSIGPPNQDDEMSSNFQKVLSPNSKISVNRFSSVGADFED